MIGFTDDIYVVLSRLLRAGRMYADPIHPVSERKLVPVLLELATWRRDEYLASRLIASALGSRHVIFPLGHPVETFHRVLTLPADAAVYLSYAVSQPFKTQTEYQARTDLVNAVSRLMHSETDVLLYEAAAMDELRFQTDRVGHEDPVVTSYELRPRWPSPYEGTGIPIMRVPLEPLEEDFVTDPFASRVDSLVDLTHLRRELYKLVHSRGRALAAQSHNVVALRPWTRRQGSVSDGMQIVTRDIHDALVRHYKTKGKVLQKAIVYHPPEDETNRRVGNCVRAAMTVTKRFSKVVPAWDFPDADRVLEDIHAEGVDAVIQSWSQMSPEEVGRDLLGRNSRHQPHGSVTASGESSLLLHNCEIELGIVALAALELQQLPQELQQYVADVETKASAIGDVEWIDKESYLADDAGRLVSEIMKRLTKSRRPNRLPSSESAPAKVDL